MLNRVGDIDGRPHFVLRTAALLIAALLCMQCVWLLAAELVRPGVDRLPTDPASAAAAAEHRDAAFWAASIGGVRGDLWAECAFTNADLLWGNKGARGDENITGTLPSARASLDHALNDSPHLSSAWLLFAGLAAGFPSLGLDATTLLKMSYYTGPSEQRSCHCGCASRCTRTNSATLKCVNLSAETFTFFWLGSRNPQLPRPTTPPLLPEKASSNKLSKISIHPRSAHSIPVQRSNPCQIKY